MTDHPHTKPSPQPRRHRWLKLALLLLLLALLVAVILEWVRRSDLPRQRVIAQLQRQTGLRVEIERLDASWSGSTQLDDLRLTLPADDKPLLAAPTMRLQHTPLLALILGQPLEFESIEIDQAVIHLQQDELDQWNLQTLVDLLQSQQQTQAPEAGPLPSIDVRNATLHLLPADGQARSLAPVNVQATSLDGAAWQIEADAGTLLSLHGRLAPQPHWQHHLTFKLDAPHEWLSILRPQLPAGWTLHAEGQLDGHRRSDRWRHALVLTSLQSRELTAAGRLGLDWTSADDLRVTMTDLLLQGKLLPVSPLLLSRGMLSWNGRLLEAANLHARAGPWSTLASGTWDSVDDLANFDVRWLMNDATDNASSSWARGSLQARISPRGLDATARARQVTFDLENQLRTRGLELNTRGSGSAVIDDLQHATLDVTFADLALASPDLNFALPGASAQLALRWPTLELLTLQAQQPAHIHAAGQLNMLNRHWTSQLSIADLHLPSFAEPLQISLTAHGDRDHVTLREGSLRTPSTHATLAGRCQLNPPGQLTAQFDLQWIAPSPSDLLPDARVPVQSLGVWSARGDLAGTLQPVALTFDGTLSNQDSQIAARTTSLTTRIHAAYDRTGKLRVTAAPFHLFDGQWSIESWRDDAASPLQVRVQTDSVELEGLDLGLDLPLGGQVDAQLQLSMPNRHWRDMQATGHAQLTNLRMDEHLLEKVDLDFTLAKSLLQAHRIELLHAAGSAQGSAKLDLDQPNLVSVHIAHARFTHPLDAVSAEIRLEGEADLQFDRVHRQWLGQARSSIELRDADLALGQLDLDLQLQPEGVVQLPRIVGHALDGSIAGSLTLDSQQWHRSRGHLRFDNIHPALLHARAPELARWEGSLDATLRFDPAAGPHPLEPTELNLTFEPHQARYRNLDIGPAQVLAFVGPHRLVVSDARFQTAGGQVTLRSTLSRRPQGTFINLNTRFSDLELNQLVHAFEPEADPMPGRLSGQGNYLAPLGRWQRATGRLDLNLTESDLAGSDVISAVYSAMSKPFGLQDQPRGVGSAQLRFEGQTLYLEKLDYFNRGVEVFATGSVLDITHGPDSPIEGVAVGTSRPLRGTDFEWIEKLDKAWSLLQSSLITVRVGGTLRKPVTQLAPLAQFESAIRRLITGPPSDH